MAIALVQQANSNTSDNGIASGLPFNLGSNATAGNTVVVAMSPAEGQTMTGVTGLGGTWSQIIAQLNGGGGAVDMEWWATTATGGTAAISGSTSGGGTYTAYAAEFSGVGAVTSGGGTYGTPTTSPSLTVSQTNGDAVLVAMFSGAGATSAGPGAPWNDYDTGDFSWSYYQDVASQISTSSANLTATWTKGTGFLDWLTVGVVLSPSIPPGVWTQSWPPGGSWSAW
jgi:hypothetical protein